MNKEKLNQLRNKKKLDVTPVKAEMETRDAFHFDLLQKSVILADGIYTDWQHREKAEHKERKKMIKKIWIGIVIQFVIVMMLLIANGLNWLEIDAVIFVSFFGAIIIQFISLLLVAAKYLYNERTTDSLKIVENLMITTISHNMDYYFKPNEDKRD
ncbi:MAG: hypothetical protein FWG67_05575 [Defluviitaleaceae bacterium]|nr:hypothetical protein [Defluviitaleaceae bacterium]